MIIADDRCSLIPTETFQTPQCALTVDDCPSAGGAAPATRRSGLKLTRAADYAVRAVVHLASIPEGEVLSQTELSRAIQVPAIFAGKVLQQLAATGLVVSRRGKRGGFGLTARGRDATMLDVIVAIEGPLALNDCLSPDTPCVRASFCAAHLVWQQAQARAIEVLKAARIDALAETSRRLLALTVAVEG